MKSRMVGNPARANLLDGDQVEKLAREYKNAPLAALASRFGISILDLSTALRREKFLTEVQPHEIQFIQTNLDRMPAQEIRDRLGMTPTQFSQICEKVLRRPMRKAGRELTMDEAVARTRWLVEEKLKLTCDDYLPRVISNAHFADNGAYNCISYAEGAKRFDSAYRHFPAVAFLVCQSYPGRFRPFQFRHAKRSEFFKGREGRRNILNAVRWVIEKKLSIDPEHVMTVCANKYFLRNADLQFYGIGPHWYLLHFSSREQMVSAVLKFYGGAENTTGSGGTWQLRKTLAQAGRPLTKCEVPDCLYDDEFGLDIHHIVPRALKNTPRFDMHAARNLIALCPNHHRAARTFTLDPVKSPSGGCRQALLDFLFSSDRSRP